MMGGLSLPSCRSAALFGKGPQRGTSQANLAWKILDNVV
jgi:hypothetical protein